MCRNSDLKVIYESDMICEPDLKKYEFIGFCFIITLLILIIVIMESSRFL